MQNSEGIKALALSCALDKVPEFHPHLMGNLKGQHASDSKRDWSPPEENVMAFLTVLYEARVGLSGPAAGLCVIGTFAWQKLLKHTW